MDRTTGNPELAELFMAARAKAIEWNGRTIHGIYGISDVPEKITLEFQSANQDPVQGVRLRMEGGTILLNGINASEMVLWQDRAPAQMELEISTKGKKSGKLWVWNSWRIEVGRNEISHSWLRNAGMLVSNTTESSGLEFACSDGIGPVDFEDLRFRIRI